MLEPLRELGRKYHEPEGIVDELRQVEVLTVRQADDRRGLGDWGDGGDLLSDVSLV